MPLRHTANQALTARATTAQPHHLGIGGGLVNEDQPGGIKHALFSHPAPARPSSAVGWHWWACLQLATKVELFLNLKTARRIAPPSATTSAPNCIGGCVDDRNGLWRCQSVYS